MFYFMFSFVHIYYVFELRSIDRILVSWFHSPAHFPFRTIPSRWIHRMRGMCGDVLIHIGWCRSRVSYSVFRCSTRSATHTVHIFAYTNSKLYIIIFCSSSSHFLLLLCASISLFVAELACNLISTHIWWMDCNLLIIHMETSWCRSLFFFLYFYLHDKLMVVDIWIIWK